jgi:glycerol-3-phosphate dehydrogenase
MSEEAVDLAAHAGHLYPASSVTADVAIEKSEAATSKNEALLHSRLPYTKEDVIRAVRHEMAQTVEDVLARRTRALFLNATAAVEMADQVAHIIAKEMGKDQDWVGEQVSAFRETAKKYLP